MKTFIIGDIHGCYDELIELTQKIGLKEEDLLISLGDIVDRGAKSVELYTYFKNRPNSIVLIGNHERKHIRQTLSYSQEIVKVQFGKQYPEFLSWLETLSYYYETPDAIIVHAAFEHDKALAEQRQEVLCGTTSGEKYLEDKYPPETHWTDHYSGAKPIIYGHAVIGDLPKIYNNTYGVDTGSCHGHFLTAIELPGFIIHQVHAKNDYWKEERRKWQVPVLQAKDWGNMELAAIKKQLVKLSYIEDPEIKEFLNSLKSWLNDLESLIETIHKKLDHIASDLHTSNGENFGIEANKYSFNSWLFKSRSGNLTTDNLKKGLHTPAMIIDLARALQLDVPEFKG